MSSPSLTKILHATDIELPPVKSLNNQPTSPSGTLSQPEPLLEYTCPICFFPPTNTRLTPCSHICCSGCLFIAVKMTMHGGAMMPAGELNIARSIFFASMVCFMASWLFFSRCPVCHVEIKGWDGKGGGVIEIKAHAIFSIWWKYMGFKAALLIVGIRGTSTNVSIILTHIDPFPELCCPMIGSLMSLLIAQCLLLPLALAPRPKAPFMFLFLSLLHNRDNFLDDIPLPLSHSQPHDPSCISCKLLSLTSFSTQQISNGFWLLHVSWPIFNESVSTGSFKMQSAAASCTMTYTSAVGWWNTNLTAGFRRASKLKI